MENQKNLGVVFGAAESLQDVAETLEKFALSCDDEEEKKPVLTTKEAAYLYSVIRPFRRFVTSIKKETAINEYTSLDADYETLVIYYSTAKNGIGQALLGKCSLPFFPEGKYYQGMEKWKKYTLEELGLID